MPPTSPYTKRQKLQDRRIQRDALASNEVTTLARGPVKVVRDVP